MDKTICPNCDGDKFGVKSISQESTIFGKFVKVKTPTTICNNCGFQFMTTTQMNVYLNKIKVAMNKLS